MKTKARTLSAAERGGGSSRYVTPDSSCCWEGAGELVTDRARIIRMGWRKKKKEKKKKKRRKKSVVVLYSVCFYTISRTKPKKN